MQPQRGSRRRWTALRGLRYEAYVALAEGEGERILDEVRSHYDILDAQCVHRIGERLISLILPLMPGATTVTSSTKPKMFRVVNTLFGFCIVADNGSAFEYVEHLGGMKAQY